MYWDQFVLFGQAIGDKLGCFKICPFENDLSAKRTCNLDLIEWGVTRHYDCRRDAKSVRVVGHALRAIAS
jgi:hypothetical protein